MSYLKLEDLVAVLNEVLPPFGSRFKKPILDAASRRVVEIDYEAAIDVMWGREAYLEDKEENMRRAIDTALGLDTTDD